MTDPRDPARRVPEAVRRLGKVHHVAVVLPTRTWQAYNGRDEDGFTAPALAARAGLEAVVMLLCRHGAAPEESS